MSSNTTFPNYINIFILKLIIMVTALYSIPVASVRRLQTHYNILTANLYLCFIDLPIYYIAFCLMSEYAVEALHTSPACIFFLFIKQIFGFQVFDAFTILSIYRYLYIVRSNHRLLKSKLWLLSAVYGQWCIVVIYPLPILSINLRVRELISRYRAIASRQRAPTSSRPH